MDSESSDSGRKGFDAARLARVPAFLEDRYLRGGKLPCALALVSRDGEIVHLSTQGSSRKDGPPLQPDALFRIASMTKPVAALAFMMLVEEGAVALDTPVHRVLPEWRGLEVHAGGGAGAPFRTEKTKAPMRMIDLMRHTSGLTYGFQFRTAVDAAYRDAGLGDHHGAHDLDAMAAALAKLPLEFSPGEAWNYSVSSDIVGLVVERVSGIPFEDFLHQRVFAPLGMHDTFFTVPANKLARLTDAYAMTPKNGVVLQDPGADSRWASKPAFCSGGGGLVSTAHDYHRFCLMLLNYGELDGQRIVSPKTIALMTQNHLPGGADLSMLSRSLFSEAAYAGTGYGLGVGVTLDVAKTLIPGSAGAYYWGGMYSTYFVVDPVERIVILFMTQLMPSTTYPVRRELQTLVYSALTRSYA